MFLQMLLIPLYFAVYQVAGAVITTGIFLIHVCVVPLLFKYSRSFQRSIIFSNFVQWPLKVDFENPSASGIEGARNLTIEFHSKVDNCPIKIGVWHILPKSVLERLESCLALCEKDEANGIFDAQLANSKTPIVMYCHGNSNSRAARHRISLYKFLQRMEYHTIALDYRGYGDSTSVNPSEDGVVEDALMVYDWLMTTVSVGKQTPSVFVWGHSLGTGISSHALGQIESLSSSLLSRDEPLPLPKGLVLEAPFTTLTEEVENIPIAKLISWLPYFRACCVRPFERGVHTFRTSSHLAAAPDIPILIVHAKDDYIVPHKLGEKLYRTLVEARRECGASVELHSFEKTEGLGHKNICLSRNLDKVIGDFVTAHQ